MKLKEQQQNLVVIFFSILCLVFSLVLSYVFGSQNWKGVALYLASTLIIVSICVCFSLLLSRAKYEKIAMEMMDTMRGVMKMAESRIIIDNKLLKYIELDAKNIWVLTKTLENDVKENDIIEAVKKNLEYGEKRYYYFIPDPDKNLQVRKNKWAFEEMYHDYLDKITFVTLSEDTLLMFDEIVIFNPNQKDAFGYTYMDFEGSGIRDQVVRISKENVQEIINCLASKINPMEERIARLMRMVIELREKTNISRKHVSMLIAMVLDGDFTREEQRDIEQELSHDKLPQKQLDNIREMLDRMRKDI